MTFEPMFLGWTNVLLFVLGAMSVLTIIVSGVRYVSSGGDPETVTAAKNSIGYSVISLLAALLAYAVVNFVIGQFSGGTETAPPDAASPFSWEATPVLMVAGSVSVPMLVLFALRRTSRVLRWIARFSAFWVHHEERVDHQEEMWFALYYAPPLYRVRLAWELVVLSPFSGRRNRRHHAQLAAAVVAEDRVYDMNRV